MVDYHGKTKGAVNSAPILFAFQNFIVLQNDIFLSITEIFDFSKWEDISEPYEVVSLHRVKVTDCCISAGNGLVKAPSNPILICTPEVAPAVGCLNSHFI